MTYPATAINIMIASPGDVVPERQIIKAQIHDWNYLHSQDRGIVLMPLTWETHSTPEMGNRPQAIINRQVLSNSDLLVAVFWTRLGTPTGESPSGTVEEIREHLAAGKSAMIYFSNKPVVLDSVDMQQYEALKDFRSECEKLGLIACYDDLEGFSRLVSRHLSQVVIDRFLPAANNMAIDDNQIVTPRIPALSVEAKQLLVEAAGSNGMVLLVRTLDGAIIQAGHREMAIQGDRRDEARWMAAVVELVKNELLASRGTKGEVYEVTNSGYQIADILDAKKAGR